jgi:hypothetical protein
MSRLRHGVKHRMAGGLTSKPQWNAGGSQNAAKEAEEKKKGGRVHGEGEHAKKRHDRPKRERGGVVQRAKGGVVGHAGHHPYGKDHDGGTHADGVHVDGTGGKASHKMTKRAHGGVIHHKHHHAKHSEHPHHDLHPHNYKRGGAVHDGIEHPDGDVHHESSHRAHRARGGRLRGEGVGAERTPLTGASKIREVTPGELPPHGIRSD